ncbi:MAG: DUF4835 family protein [Sphingobacteriia bacterium]|nr:DUF4835 family protein [Sphingobacteriia bacterium]
MNQPTARNTFLSLLMIFFLSPALSAQEFFCSVQVSAPQVQQTNREKFQELRQGLYELINERRWTDYTMTRNERIECTIAITITEEISSDQFRGKINIVLKRPVFGTSYNTTMFNYMDDKFEFQWQEGQAIEYIDNTFSSNLTSTIAFYLYLFLGLDFDSFQMMGGTPYLDKAQQIVSSAQGAREPGWKSFESMRNRYWLVENLTNSSYSNVRKFMYQYHRLGLDLMQDNMERGRQGVLTALETLQRAHREKPNLFIMQLILDAKRDEFINIFSQAAAPDKTKAANILKEMDPSKASEYDRIMRSGQ